MPETRSATSLVAHLSATVSAQRARIEEVLARAERLDDPQVLHDVRVALRRTAALARLTRGFPAPGSGEPLRRTARDLRRFLSPQRSLEVSVAILSTRFRRDPARRAVALKLARRMAPPSRGPAVPGKDAQLRLRALRSAFSIRDAELVPFSSPFAAAAPTRDDESLARLVCRRLRKKRKRILSDGMPDRQTLHALRIAAKDLRYSLEFVRGLVPGVPSLLKDFQAFQDLAGDAHDRIELIAAVRKAAGEAPAPLRRGALGLIPPLERDAARALGRARTSARSLLDRLGKTRISWV